MQQLIDLMYPSNSPERRKLRERWNEQDSLSWEKYLESYSFYRANALIWNFANNVNSYEYLYRTNSYHKDWNWLMPVVDKIEGLGYDTELVSRLDEGVGSKFYINDTVVNPQIFTRKIHAVYMTVVEFILWYNKTQENEH